EGTCERAPRVDCARLGLLDALNGADIDTGQLRQRLLGPAAACPLRGDDRRKLRGGQQTVLKEIRIKHGKLLSTSREGCLAAWFCDTTTTRQSHDKPARNATRHLPSCPPSSNPPGASPSQHRQRRGGPGQQVFAP